MNKLMFYSISFLVFFVLLVCTSNTYAECVSVGAIRFDAWYGKNYDEIGRVSEQSLAPNEFQYRAPFCSSLNANTKLELSCAKPGVMEQEIKYAVSAGLDYWAFLTYKLTDPLSLSLKHFLDSPLKSKINFSIILTPYSITQPPGSQNLNLERFAEYVVLPNYQRVFGKRPLVYFFPAGELLSNPEKVQWLAKTVAEFRTLVKAKGSADPYMVLMDFSPLRNLHVTRGLNFDAISTYAIHGNKKNAPFSALAEEANSFWSRAQSTGFKVVPTVMVGWDPRPKAKTPLPWEVSYLKSLDSVAYYQQPTEQELADHVAEAVRWVTANAKSAEANTVIIYAWNENAEGGWLVPTRGDADMRVKILGQKLRSICPAK